LECVFEIDIALRSAQLRVIEDVTNPDDIRKILRQVHSRAPHALASGTAAFCADLIAA